MGKTHRNAGCGVLRRPRRHFRDGGASRVVHRTDIDIARKRLIVQKIRRGRGDPRRICADRRTGRHFEDIVIADAASLVRGRKNEKIFPAVNIRIPRDHGFKAPRNSKGNSRSPDAPAGALTATIWFTVTSGISDPTPSFRKSLAF